ncbi:MAG TPA: hypothetical protein DEA08_02440 [Planctomycetes bacterium]|nr:hypothetical protein [Planctomycetota bacterium]
MTRTLPSPSLSSALCLLSALCLGCQSEDPAPAGEAKGPAGQPTSQPASQPAKQAEPGGPLAEAIEAAHQAQRWRSYGGIQARISLTFGGKKRFDATMTLSPAADRTRLVIEGGPTLVFDGQTAWISPAEAELPRGRFHVLTWPYFLAAPYKLADAGSQLRDLGQAKLDRERPAAKLTFSAGVGDAPDDWYVAFKDEQDRLAGLSYIVTYGKEPGAPEEPHAVVYEDHRSIEGVPVPHRWRFYNWSEGAGIEGEPIGEVVLQDVSLLPAAPADAFSAPEGARELELPGAK